MEEWGHTFDVRKGTSDTTTYECNVKTVDEDTGKIYGCPYLQCYKDEYLNKNRRRCEAELVFHARQHTDNMEDRKYAMAEYIKELRAIDGIVFEKQKS